MVVGVHIIHVNICFAAKMLVSAAEEDNLFTRVYTSSSFEQLPCMRALKVTWKC